MLVAALVAVTTAGVGAGPLAPPVAAAPTGGQLAAQLRAGTLLATHGTRPLCTGALRCDARVVTATRGSARPLSTGTPAGYGPADLARAYDLPPAPVGARGTVAIIDQGAYPDLAADLATYRHQYGLPACTTRTGCLRIVDYHGGRPLAPDPTADGRQAEEDLAGETSLDVDMASAACPYCRILEIQVPLDLDKTEDATAADFGVATDTAARLGAAAVSISYSFTPTAYLTGGPPSRDMVHPGMAITASSGDAGYTGTRTGWPHIQPTVTSVGGTSLYDDGGRFTEAAWDGAGSGCHATLPPAVGQPASVAANCGGHRTSADVAAVADPATGPAVYTTYAPYSHQPVGWTVEGGTSASSPYVGGLYARAGRLPLVLGPNTVYRAPSRALHDVTAGGNDEGNGGTCPTYALCNAGPGWDGPTGVGTPRGLTAF
jgi:hypothetical protein